MFPDSLSVYVKKERMPKLAAWNAELERLGFALRLSGFSPLKSPEHAVFMDGKTYCAVDYTFGEVMDKDHIAKEYPECTHEAQFLPHERPVSLIAAMTAAGALAMLTGGRIRGPDLRTMEPGMVSCEDVLGWARAAGRDERDVKVYLAKHLAKLPVFSNRDAGRALKAELKGLKGLMDGLLKEL